MSRLRNIKGARETIAASSYTVAEDELGNYKGKWLKSYGGNKLFVEIGMGKGSFIMEMARRRPDCLFIGIEKYSSVLLRALEKQNEAQLKNLIFIRMDAENIADVFDAGEIDGIYLNFSDPWPKDRHAHRRLTSDRFLARYKPLLSADAVIEFKTDNVALFDFSLEQINECGWNLLYSTYDLHSDKKLVEGNVMTEYEQKFSAQGNPICKCVFKPE